MAFQTGTGVALRRSSLAQAAGCKHKLSASRVTPGRSARRGRAQCWRLSMEVRPDGLAAELKAIDEYAKEQEMMRTDPWVYYLRGVVYSQYGHPNLAIKFFTNSIDVGFTLPEVYQRRAADRLAVGALEDAERDYREALIAREAAVGNPNHQLHWFVREFKEYIPPWRGPAPSCQHAAILYCLGRKDEAFQLLDLRQLAPTRTPEEAIWRMAVGAAIGGTPSDEEHPLGDEGLLKVFELFRNPCRETWDAAEQYARGEEYSSDVRSDRDLLFMAVAAREIELLGVSADNAQALVKEVEERGPRRELPEFVHFIARALVA